MVIEGPDDARPGRDGEVRVVEAEALDPHPRDGPGDDLRRAGGVRGGAGAAVTADPGQRELQRGWRQPRAGELRTEHGCVWRRGSTARSLRGRRGDVDVVDAHH